MMVNRILITIILLSVCLLLYKIYKKNANYYASYDLEEDKYSMEMLIDFIKTRFNEILKTNIYEMQLSKEEFEKCMKNRAQLRKALKICAYGDIQSKDYIKSYIRDLLVNTYGLNEENINRVIPFNNSNTLDIQLKFEIILYLFKKQYQYKALEKLILTYGLDQLKEVNSELSYTVTAEEIEDIYRKEVASLIRFEDKLNVIVQHIYQSYKGYGVIDEIRDMQIDGVSGGVSGIPSIYSGHNEVSIENNNASPPNSYDSVWIFFKGKSIHLSFLSFGCEKELIRVCKNIYRFNNPGQLSESNGYKVNEMKDGSRVVVARPPFSESWVFFVRKFDSITKTKVEDLITDKNNDLPIQLIKWLIKGCQVTAITGSQGAGKTTLLMAIIKYINPTFALRIQEMSFELQLRKIYPHRNILSFRETATITGQEGLNLQKKTDGVVNILGEVAEAGLSSLMIQISQVASLFTLFTHHAKTTEHLIYAIRNNLLQTGVFNNEKIAEQQVVDVLNFDIHLNKSVTGHRYIERITEIVPVSKHSLYSYDFKNFEKREDKIEAFMDNMQEFFYRMTDRKVFETRDIIKYEKDRYTVVKPLSRVSIKSIIKHLTVEERIDFNLFLERNWGEAVDFE